jgi:hypothetical protein
MERKLRQPTMVYGISTTGMTRLIVACASVAEAGRLFRDQYGPAMTDHYVRGWGCETRNQAEVTVAMAMPRTVFLASNTQNYFKNLITGRVYETYLAVRER